MVIPITGGLQEPVAPGSYPDNRAFEHCASARTPGGRWVRVEGIQPRARSRGKERIRRL